MRAASRGVFFGVALATVAPAQEEQDLTTATFSVVENDWLWWRSPQAGERCMQWSSFDRASKKGPRDHHAWYANDDRGHHVRVVEKDGVEEYVMVDTKGPGCLARIWSANPSGTLHFDVDGARVWSVDFLQLCEGKVDGVPEPLAGVRARGGTCYLPIPFAKSLVVSCTAGDCYYTFAVVQWPKSTEVRSFAPAQLVEHRDTMESFARALERGTPTDGELSFESDGARVQLPRQRLVRGVLLGVERVPDDGQLAAALQRVRLVVRAGRETTVDVPLPAFFGSNTWRAWRSSRLGLSDEVPGGEAHSFAWSGWRMPMPEGGSVELVHDEPSPGLRLRLRVSHDALRAKDPLLFRASYHLAKGTPTRPFGDHLVLDAVGTGRFVGCSLLVRNPSRIWWGEGDEKFTVDGEAFPSWFGTGTEDYFGYGWCDPTPFSAPFHAQVECQGPHNFGFTQLHRTHVLDSVPFRKSFRFELERWHWAEDIQVDYATVAYWYAAPGATSGLPPVPPAAERELPRLDGPPVFVAEGALEGEALRVVACSGGTHEVQDMWFRENTFSRDAHRWWRDGKPGDALVLAVPVPAAGRYKVTAALTQADDFGIVQLALAGQALGAPFDGYHTEVRSTGPRELGTVQLDAGEAELRIELTGRNERAKPRYMFGLDWLRLEKLP